MRFGSALPGLSVLALAPVVTLVLATPATAAVNNQQPGPFIETLADEALGALRGPDRVAAKAKFRTMVAQHFAVDSIGDRLIRRWKPRLTPAQLTAYKAALPNFIVGTYADRLFEYANADIKVIRVAPQGNGAVVQSQVIRPHKTNPAIWTVEKVNGGYKVSNLTVAGINLAVAQAADFDAIIQREGFDALLARLRARG